MQLRKEEKSDVMEKIRSHMPHGSHMETSSTRGEKQKSILKKQLMLDSSLRLPRSSFPSFRPSSAEHTVVSAIGEHSSHAQAF